MEDTTTEDGAGAAETPDNKVRITVTFKDHVAHYEGDMAAVVTANLGEKKAFMNIAGAGDTATIDQLIVLSVGLDEAQNKTREFIASKMADDIAAALRGEHKTEEPADE